MNLISVLELMWRNYSKALSNNNERNAAYKYLLYRIYSGDPVLIAYTVLDFLSTRPIVCVCVIETTPTHLSAWEFRYYYCV